MSRMNDGSTTPDEGLRAAIRNRGLASVFRFGRRAWTLIRAILDGATRGPNGS